MVAILGHQVVIKGTYLVTIQLKFGSNFPDKILTIFDIGYNVKLSSVEVVVLILLGVWGYQDTNLKRTHLANIPPV